MDMEADCWRDVWWVERVHASRAANSIARGGQFKGDVTCCRWPRPSHVGTHVLTVRKRTIVRDMR